MSNKATRVEDDGRDVIVRVRYDDLSNAQRAVLDRLFEMRITPSRRTGAVVSANGGVLNGLSQRGLIRSVGRVRGYGRTLWVLTEIGRLVYLSLSRAEAHRARRSA